MPAVDINSSIEENIEENIIIEQCIGVKIETHLKKLEKQLNQDKLSRFINLKLCSKGYCNNLKIRRNPDKMYSIYDVAQNFPSNKVALLGEPGSGKTTLLKELASAYVKSGALVPIFIRMGFYKCGKTIKDLFNCFDCDTDSIDYLLSNGKMIVILDGINEAQGKNINEVVYDLIEFMNEYPKNQYVLSCRTIEFPVWALNEFDEVTVMPIAAKEVKNQFTHILGSTQGLNYYEKFTKKNKYKRLRELFNNPLLLGMVISICKDEEFDNTLADINSKSVLYSKFIRKFNYHQQKKISNYVYDKYDLVGENLLCYIAYQMQRRNLVFIRDMYLKELIADFIGNNEFMLNSLENKANFAEVFKYLINKPQINSFQIAEDEPMQYAFIHQSFQEYYAASYVSKAIVSGKFCLNDLGEYLLDETRKHWEFIVFISGLMEENHKLLNYIKSKSKEFKNQSLLKLIANCIRDMKIVDKDMVSDICIRMLDAFKYWNIPFDYELIYGIKELAVNINSYFPKRVLDDITWFQNKYIHKTEPIVLNNVKSIQLLMDYANGNDAVLAIDSIHTLGKYSNYSDDCKREVVQFLLNKLEVATGEFKEYIIIALKDLSEPSSVDTLINIVEDKKEAPKVRMHALNALGNIGQLKSAYTIIAYLKDLDNMYRDSAAWALQYIGKNAVACDLNLFEHIKTMLLNCLLNEEDSMSGNYSKGTIVYSLGELNAIEFGNDILQWLKTQTLPYVLEDGIYSLGILGFIEATETLERFLVHNDPLVRVKAIEALWRLEYNFSIKQKEIILNDRFDFIREWHEVIDI